MKLRCHVMKMRSSLLLRMGNRNLLRKFKCHWINLITLLDGNVCGKYNQYFCWTSKEVFPEFWSFLCLYIWWIYNRRKTKLKKETKTELLLALFCVEPDYAKTVLSLTSKHTQICTYIVAWFINFGFSKFTALFPDPFLIMGFVILVLFGCCFFPLLGSF